MVTRSRVGVVVGVLGSFGVIAAPAGARTTVRVTGGPTSSAVVCGATHRAVTVARGATVRVRVRRTGASRRAKRPATVRISTCSGERFGKAVRRRVRTSRKLSTATNRVYRVASGRRHLYVRVGPAAATPGTPATTTTGKQRQGIYAVRNADGSESLSGHLTSGSMSFEVTARKTAAGVVTGRFHATGSLADAIGVGKVVPFDFAGPVTCLDALHDQAGLYYPLTSATPSALGPAFGGIQITLHGDEDGLGHIGFAPVPVALAPSVGCPHGGATPLAVSSGSLAVGTPAG